jgi:hypothetical protein
VLNLTRLFTTMGDIREGRIVLGPFALQRGSCGMNLTTRALRSVATSSGPKTRYRLSRLGDVIVLPHYDDARWSCQRTCVNTSRHHEGRLCSFAQSCLEVCGYRIKISRTESTSAHRRQENRAVGILPGPTALAACSSGRSVRTLFLMVTSPRNHILMLFVLGPDLGLRSSAACIECVRFSWPVFIFIFR